MRTTIRDIAAAVGVSPSTVSRAMSSDGVVSPATRARIQEVATRLGYQTNRAAQGLITGRTKNLGLIVPDLRNPFFADIAKGAQDRARTADYAVFISDSDEDSGTEMETISSFSQGIDGLVLCSPQASDAAIIERADPRSTVLLHRKIDGFASVTADVASGMHQAVDHLRAFGHTTIAYVSGPQTSWAGAQRHEGFASSETAGLSELLDLGVVAPHFEGGVAIADMLLASPATAVIAYNDIVALGLMSRLAIRGVRVPEDISVVGCDDVAVSAMLTPPLTSVSVPKSQAARIGVDLLLRILNDPHHELENISLPTQLIVRSSTGVPAAPSAP